MEILGLIALPGWLVGILLFVFSICLYSWYKQSFYTRLGIKQKSTWLFVGDLPIMFKKGLSYVDAEMVKKNGKCFGSYIGNVPSLIVSDPEMLKQILVKDFSKFTDRASVVPIPKMWQSALSVANGDHWKYLRQTLSPTFSTGKLKHMSPHILNCQRNLMEILEEKRVAQGDGFDIVPTIRGFTMDVICSTSFGIEVDSQRNPDNPFIKHSKEFLDVEVAGNPLFLVSFLFPDLNFLIQKMEVQFISKTAWNFFKTTTETLFAERKEDKSNRKDFLQLLINASKGKENNNAAETKGELTYEDYKAAGLTDQDVLINSIIFMIAGYDTTAITLCWLAYELAINPDVQDKLIAEVDENIGKEQPNYENAFKLEYLDMVINEILRMHPPAARLNRMAMEDVDICGVPLKKGMEVVYSPLALHYMPEYWPEPDVFRPERFAPENQDSINPYAYLPFGSGPRNCIGMRLALLEVKMTMIAILQKYRIVKSPKLKVPIPVSRIGLIKPAEPVFVKLEERS